MCFLSSPEADDRRIGTGLSGRRSLASLVGGERRERKS